MPALYPQPVLYVKAIELGIMPRHLSHLVVVLMALSAALLSGTHLAKATSSLPSYVPDFTALSIIPAITQKQNLHPPLVLTTSTSKTALAVVSQPVISDGATQMVLQLTPPVAGEQAASVELAMVEEQPAQPAVTPRPEIISYEVAPGDTISGIAQRFAISPETLVWANGLSNTDSIRMGLQLTVLPTSGVLHTVGRGETLESIGIRYGVLPQIIAEYAGNDLSQPDIIAIGQKIIVPGEQPPKTPPPPPAPAVAPAPALASAPTPASAAVPAPVTAPGVGVATGSFTWPLRGPLFTYFSADHPGIDISPPYGTPVVAADGGVVTQAVKLNWSFGWYLVIDHGNGFTSQYSHLSAFDVGVGDEVAKGQLIGRNGSTGKSTGPHLDFRIYRYGKEVDPLVYLPK